MKGIVLSLLLISMASAHQFCQNTDFIVFQDDKNSCDMPRAVFASLLFIDDDGSLDLVLGSKSMTVDRNTQFDIATKMELCEESKVKDCEVSWGLGANNATNGKFKITIKVGEKTMVSVV